MTGRRLSVAILKSLRRKTITMPKKVVNNIAVKIESAFVTIEQIRELCESSLTTEEELM
jgi:hypothetical protein